MADMRRRTKLGPKASKALVQLWTEMDSRDLSDADLARVLDDHTGKIAKLLYGDRKPGRTLSANLLDILGIPIADWDKPCPVKRRPHLDQRPSTPPPSSRAA